MNKKRKFVSLAVAVAAALPVLAIAVKAAHFPANAVFCDDGSFATQGMFSQFVPPTFFWAGGGTNPKVQGDEYIGLRIDGQNLPVGNFIFQVNADRDLRLDNGAVIVYQYIVNGTTTTVTKTIAGAPANGLVVASNGHNQFTITMNGLTNGASGVWGNIYFDDQGRTAGVPFQDNVINVKVNGKTLFPGAASLTAPLQDCTGL
ncbi:MAG TPA: hypothetical protein V6C89_00515 [Drouetiella sp.]|jgi:hypothetical protein